MASELAQAIQEVCNDKKISLESVISTIESALAAAYRKDFGNKLQNIKVEFNMETGAFRVFDVKEVVEDKLKEEYERIKEEKLKLAEQEKTLEEFKIDEKKKEEWEEEKEEIKKFNPKTMMGLSEAKEIKKKIKLGEELVQELPVGGEFGRMAAQTAKQVIIQRLREAERDTIYKEYKSKIGELVNGTVQRVEGRVVLVDFGNITAVMPFEEAIKTERYIPGARFKFYIKNVEESSRGPKVIVSRTHPDILRKLFRLEVPEVASGSVQIKSIAREAGSRSKVAVTAKEENIDPIGSCFHGSSWVLTEDLSYRPIVELTEGEGVINHLGKRALVTRKFKRIWNGTTLKFKLFGIYRELEATKEHPFLFTTNYNSLEEFKVASEIKGGFLAIPTLENLVLDKTVYHFEKDRDFLWVLGMYLAEGSLDRARVTFTLSKEEKDKALRIKKIMSKYGGRVEIYKPESRPSILDVRLFGYKWENVFRELGGIYCSEKKINTRLMFISPELQLAIYEGWKDGDGYVDKKKNKTVVVTTSEKLLWQMYHILLRNRMRGNMQKRKDRQGRKEAYVLEIAHKKTKDYRGFFRDGFYFSRIREIEKGRAMAGRRVYNLEVEPDNTYVVYSAAVHNCVGQRGTRVQTIINEVGGEKIDIIEWEENSEKFIAKALAPAKVIRVEIKKQENKKTGKKDSKKTEIKEAEVKEGGGLREAIVYVVPEQLSLAIGKGGQNVRLAAKLTGWKIDIMEEKIEEEKGTDKKEAKEVESEKKEKVKEGDEVKKEEKKEKVGDKKEEKKKQVKESKLEIKEDKKEEKKEEKEKQESVGTGDSPVEDKKEDPPVTPERSDGGRGKEKKKEKKSVETQDLASQGEKEEKAEVNETKEKKEENKEE